MTLSTLLTEIDKLKAQYDKLKPFDEKIKEGLKDLFDVELTYNSNAIEGSTLSYSETKQILKEGLSVGGKKMRELMEAVNHKAAIDYIESLKEQSSYEITEQAILNIHDLILRGIDTANAGKYRVDRVRIARSRTIFPNPAKVPELMEHFRQWLQTSTTDHPVIRAGEAHFRLVTIHPFIDGNGRTARLLMNLMLLQQGFPLFTIKIENRKSYLDSLESAQAGGEGLDDFYVIVVEALKESLEIHIEALAERIHYQ